MVLAQIPIELDRRPRHKPMHLQPPEFCPKHNGAPSTNVAGEIGYLPVKNKLDPCLSPCTNINSKRIKGLNTRPGTLKLLQGRVGNTLELIGIGNDFVNRTPD
jgi:hypothetical protein